MNSISLILRAGALALPVMLTATGAFAQDVAAGEEAFIRVGCYTCHGYQGQGANTGPRIAPGPLPLEAFNTFLRQTSGDMPPYTPAVLSDDEVANIHAYLATMPEAPDPASVPLLQNVE